MIRLVVQRSRAIGLRIQNLLYRVVTTSAMASYSRLEKTALLIEHDDLEVIE